VIVDSNDPARDTLELAVDKDGIALVQVEAVVVVGVTSVDIGETDIHQRGLRLDLGF
jgi:hypothetical protein